MDWIKTWYLIDDANTYLTLAWSKSDEGKEWFSRPQILSGWQVKRLFEGAYIAAELHRPASIKECR